MKFSIILPIYNVEKYLRPCIDSILSQTYKDYEIILVDDGSKDSSGHICDEYGEKYSCVKVFHKPNGGQADARNYGLPYAKGDYVFFVDSDDYLIDNEVLSKLVEKSKLNPDVIAFKSVKWFESTDKLSTCTNKLQVSSPNLVATEMYLELIDRDTYYNSPWSKIIRRELLTDNKIEFESGLLGEDNDWYYKIVSYVNTLELIDEPLYVYRQRAGSTTKTSSTKNLEHLLLIIEKWISFVEEGEQTENKKVIRNSLAKQYCHAIIGYANLGAPAEYEDRLIRLKYLLQYSQNPRVRVFRKLNSFIGLSGIVMLLRLRKLIKK